VEIHCTAEKVTDENLAHEYYMLDISVYKYTFRIYNSYSLFSTATMVARKRLSVMAYLHFFLFCLSEPE